MKAVIEVTQEDIREGVRGSYCNCPIARAFRRTLGNLWCINGSRAMRTDRFTKGECVELPPEARDFIGHFDNGCAVAPLSFDIDAYWQGSGTLIGC